MSSQAAELAHRLARDAEAVCRHYLSNGRREGRYWLVGDVANTPGRSLFVRLKGPASGKGAVGKWTDAATGEHGDLLDLIAMNRGLDRLRDVLDEARSFLSLPRPDPTVGNLRRPLEPSGSPESARRLFAMAQPIMGTIAEAYLRKRGITALHGVGALRFHPRCYYRADVDVPTETWPALIAAVTDLGGRITGAHRTWLDPSGEDKAPVDTPRRAMGHLLGHGVRFGVAGDTMAAGEGIETMLSLRSIMPTLPMLAALSANHLAALLFPPTLRRLYIARDDDPAGDEALATLIERTQTAGIEALGLSPTVGDFNEDLRRLGLANLRATLRVQLAPEECPDSWERWRTPGRDDVGDSGSPRCGPHRIEVVLPLSEGSRADGLLEGDRDGVRPGFRNGGQRLFSAASKEGRFASRDKIAAARRPPLRSGRCRCARRCRPRPPAVR